MPNAVCEGRLLAVFKTSFVLWPPNVIWYMQNFNLSQNRHITNTHRGVFAYQPNIMKLCIRQESHP